MLVVQFAAKLDVKLIVIVYTLGNELGLLFQVFLGSNPIFIRCSFD